MSAAVRPQQRSFFFQWTLLIQIPNTSKYRVSIYGIYSHKWSIYITPSLLEAQGTLLKRRQKESKSLLIRQDHYTDNSRQLWHEPTLQHVCTRDSQGPSCSTSGKWWLLGKKRLFPLGIGPWYVTHMPVNSPTPSFILAAPKQTQWVTKEEGRGKWWRCYEARREICGGGEVQWIGRELDILKIHCILTSNLRRINKKYYI